MSDSEVLLMDLSARGLIRVSGPDARKFLQSQLTNDINLVDAEHGQLSAYCNPKGRMFGIFRIFYGGENTCYLDVENGLPENLLKRLKMFVMRAMVVLEDASQDMRSIGVSGDTAKRILVELNIEPPQEDYAQAAALDGMIMKIPGTESRYQLLLPTDSMQMLWNKLAERARIGDHHDWRGLDIANQLPVVHLETQERFTPQMLNLDQLGGVSFNKGCYPGQEVVARTHFLGKAKQAMTPGRVKGNSTIAPGKPVYAESDPRQAAGYIVDAIEHEGDMMLLTTIKESAAERPVHLGSPDGPLISLG